MVVESPSFGRGFILVDFGQIMLEAHYPSLFSNTAIAQIDVQYIEIIKKSFWKSGFDIVKNNILSGQIKFNWNGSTDFNFNDSWGLDRFFTLKHKGFWKTSYILYDEDQNIVFTIKPVWDWGRFKQTFELNDLQEILNEITFLELVFYSIYSIKILRNRKSAAASN